MNPKKVCSICEMPIAENYCSRCGQKISDKPTSIISLITDFFSNFFSLEKSAFATIFKILSDPKPIVNNYYSGFKNYYASPGKILLYGIAVIALHLNLVSEKIMGLSLGSWNINTQYLFWLIVFPFILIASYLTFIRTEKSFSKHLISIIYLSSSLFIALTILTDIFILVAGDILGVWTFAIFELLIFFWNSRVFTTKKKFLFIILNTIIQISIFMGIVGILIVIKNLINSV